MSLMRGEVTNCLKPLRRAAKMTQQELAEKVGVTRQTIIAIEKGNYTPSVLLSLQLAEVLNTKVEKIFECK